MTDRELLELAARAAGIDLPEPGPWLEYSDTHGFMWMNMDGSRPEQTFNPLNDDGDALRMAVKLRIELVGVVNDAFGDPFVLVHGRNRKEFTEVVVDTELSLLATRRAIVRAAAEIGKGIQ